MSRQASISLTLTILAIAFSATPLIAQAAEPRARIAIVPVVARDGGRAAVDTVTNLLSRALGEQGYVHFVDADLRPILRHYRIRSSMGVDQNSSTLLAGESTATHPLLATIETWSSDPIPEVAISARVLRPGDTMVAEAAGVAVTSDDHPGIFNTKRLSTLDTLAVHAVNDLIMRLDFPDARESNADTTPLLAVIPLDAPAGSSSEANAATAWLLTALVEEGLHVLEPGDMNSLLYANQRSPRGSIDLDALGFLHDELGVDFVLTGSVDLWTRLAGDPSLGAPKLIWGLRLLDADTLRLVDTFEHEYDGHNGESFLGRGRVRALGELAHQASRSVAETIRKKTKPVTIEVSE